MKKLLYLALLFIAQSLNSSNLCRDFKYTGQKLRHANPEIIECLCNCWQYPKVKIDQGYGYGCLQCGHRLLPEDVFPEKKTAQKKSANPTWDPKSHKCQRYTQATKNKS